MPLSAAEVFAFTRSYTDAWNSGDAEAVAAHYATDGQIVINRGTPWIGRDGVATMAAGFFADVAGLFLTCDAVRQAGDHVAYFWTFTGHHSGTGAPLRIEGWEEWDMADASTIQASRGWYDAAGYAAQVAGDGPTAA